MRRNFHSLKERKLYQELSFPKWVIVTPCETYSRTRLLPDRHGVVRRVLHRRVIDVPR